MTQQSALSLLVLHIQDLADEGRWDLVGRWISYGLQDHRNSREPELKRLCVMATKYARR